MTYIRIHAAIQNVAKHYIHKGNWYFQKSAKIQMLHYQNPGKLRVNLENFYVLPCSDDFSLIGTYTEFFDIIGILYNKENLREDVLTHIKQQCVYYTKISQSYLAWKKLNFLNWCVGVTDVNIPADELLVFTCSVYLNIHILWII